MSKMLRDAWAIVCFAFALLIYNLWILEYVGFEAAVLTMVLMVCNIALLSIDIN